MAPDAHWWENDASDVPHPAGGPDLGQASPDLVALNRGHIAAPISGLGAIRHFMVPAFHIGFFIFPKMDGDASTNFTASQLAAIRGMPRGGPQDRLLCVPSSLERTTDYHQQLPSRQSRKAKVRICKHEPTRFHGELHAGPRFEMVQFEIAQWGISFAPLVPCCCYAVFDVHVRGQKCQQECLHMPALSPEYLQLCL